MEPLLQTQESLLKKYLNHMKKNRTSLMAGDHPESDLSDFCNQDQSKQYQTIVGQ